MAGLTVAPRTLPLPRPKSGEYVTASAGATNGFAAALPNNLLYFVPIDLAAQASFNLIGLNITGSGSGPVAPVIRLGLYRDNGVGRPGALLVDAQTVDAGAANKQIALTATLPGGRSWLAVVAQGCDTTNPIVSIMRGSIPGIVNLTTPPTLGSASYQQSSGAGGALPAVAAPDLTSPDAPLIWLRAA